MRRGEWMFQSSDSAATCLKPPGREGRAYDYNDNTQQSWM